MKAVPVVVTVLVLGLFTAMPLTASADALADFNAGRKALDEKRYDAAIGLFTRVIRSGELTGENLGKAHCNRGLAYERAEDDAKAYDDFRACAEYWPVDSFSFQKLVQIGLKLGRYDEARKNVGPFLDRAGDDASSIMFNVVTLARHDQMNGRWREADTLLQRYAQANPDAKPIELARARSNAALGLPAIAVGLVRKVDNLYAANLTRADRGFERVWNDPGFLAATDIPAMLARDLGDAERDTVADPNKLQKVVAQMEALRRVGRSDDAIALGERTLASDLARFTDRKAYEVWIRDEIARSAKFKGDFALAEGAYRRGIERLGDQDPTVVNIIINGAAFLAEDAGKYQEAIDLAQRAKRVGASAFGNMQADSAAFAAHWGAGRTADVSRVLAQLEKNIDDDPNATIEALFLVGRAEDAARIVATMLTNPRHVDSMILRLQRYTARRPAQGPAAKAVEAGWNALRRHPQVLAALAKVGRIIDVPASGFY